MSRPEIVFTRLHLPRGLTPADMHDLLVAVTGARHLGDLVFEVRSGAETTYLLGCEPTALREAQRILSAFVPGITYESVGARPDVPEVGELELRPQSLPLTTDRPELVTTAILSAIAQRLSPEEHVVMQIVLGRRFGGQHVPPGTPSTTQAWHRTLLHGVQPAAATERSQLRVRAEDVSFEVTVRLGARGRDPERTRRLSRRLQNALRTANGVGVQMQFRHAAPHSVATARMGRRRLRLSAHELVGLLAFPLGEGDLPGLPPMHPARLRAAANVATTERTFVRSLAPGDNRMLGISPADSLLHVAVTGRIGAGKSTLLEHLAGFPIREGRALALLDPKQSLAEAVAAAVPASERDRVIYLDPSRLPCIAWNPLDVSDRDADIVADGLLNVFSTIFSAGWGFRTNDLFSAGLRTLLRAAKITGRQAILSDLPRLLTDPSFRRPLVRLVADDEALAGFWAAWEAQSPQAQAAIMAAPANKLRTLTLRPSLQRMLGQRESTFKLGNIWRDRLILIAGLNSSTLGVGATELIGNLLTADLHASVLARANEPDDPRNRPGMIIVDEAPRLAGHLGAGHTFGESMAVARGMGVGWVLAAQSFVAQMGLETARELDTNAVSKIMMSTSYEEAKFFTRGQSRLTVEDALSLGKHQAYARLAADGHPTNWALVGTLPPPRRLIAPEDVWRHSVDRWASPLAPPGASAPDQDGASDKPSPPPPPSPPLGGKRRDRP